jgi:RNA polymerase sigma factor (sigma-70 family)
MATANLSDFLRRLTRGMAAETLGDQSDRQLVERALAGRDQAACQAIVQRHGAMVYRVCLRVLQHPQDAEDAFQATFLVLAQKLRTVRNRASLASWLHGVAHRVALKARAQAAARRRHEHQASLPDTLPPDDITWGELRSALDAELGQLPDKWRLPLILCYLEGRTQDEAAGQLACSKSTLRRRLEEARTALGCRLNGRGIVWPGALSAILLADCVAPAAPAPGLVAATVEAAADVAAGNRVGLAATARVAALAEGGLQAMSMIRLKIATLVFLVLALLGSGAGLLALPAEDAIQQGGKKAGASRPAAPKNKVPKAVVKPLAQAPWWQPLATSLVKDSGLCGIVVDHNTGCVWINVNGKGVYCSGAGARNFQRVQGYHLKGRNETPGCWLLDPTGKSRRAVTALVNGCQCSVSPDHLATWKCMAETVKEVDWCAVDWTDPDMKFVLARKHGAAGLLLASNDGGQTFHEVGKGYATGWVFDGQTAVVAQARSKDRPSPNLMRTTDGGKTFRPCGAYCPAGTGSGQALPRWRDGVLYWLVEGGLIATADRGVTWKKLSSIDGQYGPVFGKDARHLFVLTRAGIVESTDGGTTWSRPIAPPAGLKGISALTWIDYDPGNDLLYILKMGSDLYRLARRR